MSHLRWIFVVALCVGVVGCERDRDREHPAQQGTARREAPRTEPSTAQMSHVEMSRRDNLHNQMAMTRTSAAAAQAISVARCEREERCGHIGPDQSFDTTNDCVTQVRHDWAQELSAYECPNGVEQTQLTECLNEIRQEDCGNPFDTLARAVECRTGDICHA